MQTPNSDDRRRLVRRASVSGSSSRDSLLSDSRPVKRPKFVHPTPINTGDLVQELDLVSRENAHLRQVLFGIERNVPVSVSRPKTVIYGKKGYKSKRSEKNYDRKAVKVAKRVKFVKGFVRKGYRKRYSKLGKPRLPARKENKH